MIYYSGRIRPPYGTNLEKLIKGARELKDSGVDILTIADSPWQKLGQIRYDSSQNQERSRHRCNAPYMLQG